MAKGILIKIVSLVAHLLAIAVVIYLSLPIARWYLDKLPVRGVDVYLSASYVSQLLSDFAFRFNGWKDIWFSGVPYSRDYPSFYFYLMVPFAKAFGLIPGIQNFAMFALLIFAVFSYLLYQELSKNRILAVVLTMTTVFSANLYRSLVWAGGIPFWTTQAFFPLVLFFIVKYCRKENSRWLFLGALVAGLGIMGHPQNFLNIILPSSVLLLLFWRPAEEKFRLRKRILDIFKFGGVTYLIGLPAISQLVTLKSFIVSLLAVVLKPVNQAPPSSTGGGEISSQTVIDIENWTRAQFGRVFSDSNSLLWYLLALSLAIFVLSLLLRKEKVKSLISFIPFGGLAGFIIGLVFLYSRGIDFYVTGWYKAFWPTLVGAAALASFCWGEAKLVLNEQSFWEKKESKLIKWIGIIIVNSLLIITGFYFLQNSHKTTIEQLEKIDNPSSAFPDVLNYQVKEKELKELAVSLKPQLMIDDSHSFRLYDIDATVNIWWGALQDMSLARGYVDPPLSTEERWGLFWLDASLGPGKEGKSSLIEDWKTPEEVLDNNIPFLLDWYGARYLEGNHVSRTNSTFASNLIQEKFIEEKETVVVRGIIENSMGENGKPEIWNPEGKQELNFYRIKQDLVSPILISTDASPVLYIGTDNGYDTLMRFLGEANLGPRKIVLVRGPKSIDDLSLNDLLNFDALILYKYDYQDYNRVWRLLGRYCEKGGNIFVDTGTEAKESDTLKLYKDSAAELPGIFPIKRTKREDLGQVWDPEVGDSPLVSGIDFTSFSPLVFDDGVWNISHPLSDEDIREDSWVILRHRGVAVIAERTMGEGKIIWSGYNLPYHTIRDYNPEEKKFFINLLGELINLEEKPVLSSGKWLSPRERVIEVKGAKGVVFKEQSFTGWKATLGGKNLKIYKTGPSSPGFMYVRLPKDVEGQLKFTYTGAFDAKLYSLISLLTIIFVLDYLLGGKVLFVLVKRLTGSLHGRTKKWWIKEDEY